MNSESYIYDSKHGRKRGILGIMESLFRVVSIVLLALTACLVGLDTETKVVYFSISRKATYRDLKVFYDLVWIDSAAAVYNVLQLIIRCYGIPGFRNYRSPSYVYLAWGFYLLDQVSVYVVFASQTAAIGASVMAITGVESFEWMKLCDKYTRFCFQIGGALLCGYIASLSMAITTSISAYGLFRLYSPRQFMRLKAPTTKWSNTNELFNK